MPFAWNISSLVLLIIGLIILILGILGYKKSGDKAPLYIAVAFGLFSALNIMLSFGFVKTQDTTTSVIRILGFLLILLAVYPYLKKEEPFIKEQ